MRYVFLTRERWALSEILRAAFWIIAAIAANFVLWWATDTRAQVPHEAQTYRRDYTRIVRSEWGLNAPVASLAAQIHQESGWNCRAVSAVGARSCAQFMPATANWIQEVRPDLKSDALYSPRWSFRAQAVYLRWLHDRVKGPAPCERMAFALSGYNGGESWRLKRQRIAAARGIDPRRCFDATCEINPGVSAASQRENAGYPRRILLTLEPRYEAWGPGSC